MTAVRTAAPRRAGLRRPGAWRTNPKTALAPLACTALALMLAACGGHSTPRATDDAADTVKNLGAAPIPRPPTAQATPTAGEKHLQLLAMGYSVHAQLPGADAVVTAGGPTENPIAKPGGVPDHANGTITVTVREATGPLTLHAADFTSRDENGKAVPLSVRGPATVTARPGHTAALTLTGTYEAGAAELTWRHDGRTIAIWDFNIELD
ncbi:hypothetical protein RKE30_25015 [Streptomyces sp. Li-HN-5-11]|uniref:hypothetical protein n=1 Tax=Streptomyces sp. Li-HN-5-11 TaxID=3075432 RepID=UPI0028B21999|nr:hypothetical protein [Streptomyces sp. Li-HN-5-11]WNM33417.1 hypothetical protein RKE30_25015 [Streptomyces sp. Li-HN-5-11]